MRAKHSSDGLQSIGFGLLFLASGIYSVFHDGLYIVSPRHGFALTESFRLVGASGLILIGAGILCHRLVGDANDHNGLSAALPCWQESSACCWSSGRYCYITRCYC